MSYVMDIAKEGDTIAEDDAVDEYPGVQCVVDAKSMLYLYGLELDYSDELVGGGFKFINREYPSRVWSGRVLSSRTSSESFLNFLLAVSLSCKANAEESCGCGSSFGV